MSDVQPVIYRNLSVRGAQRGTLYRETNVIPIGFGFSKGVNRCKVVHYVPWQIDPLFFKLTAQDYLGYSRVLTDFIGNKYLGRFLPWEHPAVQNYLYVQNIDFDGDVCKGQDAVGMGRFDEAVVTVRMDSLPYQVLTDAELQAKATVKGNPWPDEATLLRYVSCTYRTAARYEMMPAAGALAYVLDSSPVSTRRPQLFVEGDLRITWHQVPLDAVPVTAIMNAVGKSTRINTAAAISDSLTEGSIVQSYIKEQFVLLTLVCQVPEITPAYRMVNGEFAVDINYWLKHYPNGANSLFRWDRGQWQPVAFANGGGSPFPPFQLASLFRPEP